MEELGKIRDLKANIVGMLTTISGTVTRTTEVRPELAVGVFSCRACGTRSNPVVQQFRYTEPKICKNHDCDNKHEWELITKDSMFYDW